MQFNISSIKLRQYGLDAAFNGRMIRAVTGDKLLDNGLERRGRKKCVRYTLGTNAADWRSKRGRFKVGNELWTSDD